MGHLFSNLKLGETQVFRIDTKESKHHPWMGKKERITKAFQYDSSLQQSNIQ